MNRRMKITTRTLTIVTTALIAATATLASPSVSMAQVRGGGAQRGPDRMQIEQRLQARFGQLVQRELALASDEQSRLAGVIRSFDQERRELARRKAAIQVRLGGRGVLDPQSRGAPLLPDDQARAILREMEAIREAEFQLLGREHEALLTVLTPPQLVRFFALREDLSRRVRRLTGAPEPGRGRGGRGGGPGGGGPGTLTGGVGFE